MSYLNLQIGDQVAAADVGGLFEPGPARWFALLCLAQREEQAEAWLSRRGVYSFHPVTVRRSRVRGRVREYQRRYLPGYVFARFGGAPIYHRVLESPFIFGALLRSDGEWGVLGPDGLTALHEMRARDDRIEEQRRELRRAAKRVRSLRVGERALFRAGPFAGQNCEVVDIAGGGVKVRLELFCQSSLVEVRSRDLVGVANEGG